MSAELEIDDSTARLSGAVETGAPGTGPLDSRRPNVSGDLPTVFRAAPMFRRSLSGYDRFQVDTYVQWAEDELASAGFEGIGIISGTVFIVVVLLFRRGVWGTIRHYWLQWQARRHTTGKA